MRCILGIEEKFRSNDIMFRSKLKVEGKIGAMNSAIVNRITE